jgi:fructose-bisphosphate aldolase, class I
VKNIFLENLKDHIMNYNNELASTIKALAIKGKGLLAADESTSTIGKRFASINVENTLENRNAYRTLLAHTKGLNKHISGVILYKESFEQNIASIFTANGIVPGIKVDDGLSIMPETLNESFTKGLDDLNNKLETYKKLGAKFAKWRNVYTVSSETPSESIIRSGADNLARYALTCQAYGIVPIVEPEILIDGSHDINLCAKISSQVLNSVFIALFHYKVQLEYIILKPSMITAGIDYNTPSSAKEVAARTLKILRDVVPVGVPLITFLSGGQTPLQSSDNLRAMNVNASNPWILSFSYGRALQEDCLKAWSGKKENVLKAQDVLLECARINGLASLGQ